MENVWWIYEHAHQQKCGSPNIIITSICLLCENAPAQKSNEKLTEVWIYGN